MKTTFRAIACTAALIATPATLYLGDDKSCKLIDAETGKLTGEIVVPKEIGDGPVWKWMALVDGTLYALVGKEEPPDPTMKGGRLARGWPWRGGALGQGYDSKTYPWGFGNTVVAIDPEAPCAVEVTVEQGAAHAGPIVWTLLLLAGVPFVIALYQLYWESRRWQDSNVG